jgi:hypothetical protein
MHLTLWWYLDGQMDGSGDRVCKFNINGVEQPKGSPYARYTYTEMTGYQSGKDFVYKGNRHDNDKGGDGGFVHLRIGAASKIGRFSEQPYRGNASADFTIDELYAWQREDILTNRSLFWSWGRYYKPSGAGEGVFTSQAISFIPNQIRALAPPSSATAPTPAGAPSAPTAIPPGIGYQLESTVIRILGVSWTWYGEDILLDTAGANSNKNFEKYHRVLYDWNNPAEYNGKPKMDVQPKVEISIRDGTTTTYGPYDDDGFSAVVDPATGTSPKMNNPNQIHYLAAFRMQAMTTSTVLLSTPVLDDITIYWNDDRTRLLSYLYDNRSF